MLWKNPNPDSTDYKYKDRFVVTVPCRSFFYNVSVSGDANIFIPIVVVLRKSDHANQKIRLGPPNS